MQMNALRSNWLNLAAYYQIQDANVLFEQLTAAYSEPHRAYHTLKHIAECLSWFEQVKHLLHDPHLVELMIWMHDVVYDHKQTDNEWQSAQYAKRIFKHNLCEQQLVALAQGILATAGHEAQLDNDLQYLIDIDLAILGASPQRFIEYQEQIRFEYQQVEEQHYQVKRAEILAAFYQKQPLFMSSYFYEKLEASAKANLAHALGVGTE